MLRPPGSLEIFLSTKGTIGQSQDPSTWKSSWIFFRCMKIGTDRSLEDPIGFGTSPGFCSTTQRIYGVFRLPVFAFLLLAFAVSPKWPGALGRVERVRLMAERTWKLQQKCRCFKSTVEFLQLGWWISHLSDKLYWPFFSEGTCNFRTITERERCFIDMSIRPLLWLQK